MKRTGAMLGFVIALSGIVAIGGCVPKAEYDRALTVCRRANDELLKSKEELQTAQAETEQLKGQLTISEQTIASRQSEIELLESKHADLEQSFQSLEAMYRKLQASDTPPPIGPLVLLPQPVDKALRGFATDNPELVEYLPQYGMVKFKSDFTFEKGSDDVSAEAAGALGKLVTILNSDVAKMFHVYIAGHTDDIPIKKPATLRRHPTNWYLSAHRAVEVQKELTKGGLEPARIAVMGFGEYHPIAPNQPNLKGNEKNRRVEIWILPPDRLLTLSAQATAGE